MIPIAPACERVRESALRKCVNSDEYALHLVTMVQSAHDVTAGLWPPQMTDANRNREEGAIDEVFPATWTLDANRRRLCAVSAAVLWITAAVGYVTLEAMRPRAFGPRTATSIITSVISG